MAKQGLMILGGVVDWDYRGEVGVIIHNSGPNEYIPLQGDRIAQLTIEPLAHPTSVKHTRWAHYDKWNTPTKRGEQGFGHSGRFVEASACHNFSRIFPIFSRLLRIILLLAHL